KRARANAEKKAARQAAGGSTASSSSERKPPRRRRRGGGGRGGSGSQSSAACGAARRTGAHQPGCEQHDDRRVILRGGRCAFRRCPFAGLQASGSPTIRISASAFVDVASPLRRR